ncbi:MULTISPECIES: hypothetical protein, partial [unclassified Synechococcus]|uniref:hypothetical protein n=1 Tax=unclassified Synechococcus TaxID=2626047 RepID=UPI001C244B9E
VRFMVESPAQSGRLKTLIHPGPVFGVHVTYTISANPIAFFFFFVLNALLAAFLLFVTVVVGRRVVTGTRPR